MAPSPLAQLRSTSQNDEYYFTLGKFVDDFATAERFFHLSFSQFARIPSLVAMAIKGGMRMSDLFPILRTLLELNKWPEADKPFMLGAMDQFTTISTLRDKILHRGATAQDDGSYLAENFATSRSPTTIDNTIFEVEHLRQCSRDLQVITLRVIAIAFPDNRADSEEYFDLVAHSWLYKPPKQESKAQPDRPKTQKRERPSPSSQD